MMSTRFEDQILYEDNHILVVNKLSSQIVHGDKTGDRSLVDEIKDYLRKRYNKKGNIYCGVVHRLDRPVSGALVFAKTSKALARLNKAVHDREIEKKYWAITKNPPPAEEGFLLDYLIKDGSKNKSFVTRDKSRGLKAELSYRWIARSNHYNLLEVDLHTGRHHQIRVQLSNMGTPIKGDLKYGFDRSNKDASISLHSRELSFKHPVRNLHLRFIVPVPEDSLWEYFQEAYFEL